MERYCVWILPNQVTQAQSIPGIKTRIDNVKTFRLASKAASTRDYAQHAYRFRQVQGQVKNHSIIIPRVTSDLRPYIACGVLDANSVVLDSAFAIYDPPIWVFSIISSKLHIVWIKAVCGKLKTDYRYSNTLGYNTFPIPDLSEAQKQSLEEHAWQIIEAREAHPGKTIAWLYNPDTMPENLLTAHRDLDDILEKIYIGRPFENDTERLEHLFKLYAKMTKQKAA